MGKEISHSTTYKLSDTDVGDIGLQLSGIEK